MMLRFDFRKKRNLFPYLIISVLFLILVAALVQSGQLYTIQNKMLSIAKKSKTLLVSKPKPSPKIFQLSSKKQQASTNKENFEKNASQSKLQLCGIALLEEEKYVFLRDDENSSYILKEGSLCGKFKIERITLDSVIIVWSDGKGEILKW